MSPIGRLALLYFTAFRWQRSLTLIGVLVLVVGLGGMLIWRDTGAALVLAGLAAALLPTAASAGFVLRALSARRTQRLAPGFRRRMLGALSLVVTIEAAGATLAWALVAPTLSSAVWLEGLAVGALLSSALLFWTFAVTGPPLQTLLLVAATYGLGAWAAQAASTAWAANVALAAAAACALLWVLFGVWYARVRSIAPVGIFQSVSLPPAIAGAPATGVTRSAGLYLGDRLPWRAPRRLALLATLAAAAAGVVWVLDRLDRRIELPLSTLLNFPLIVTFLGFPRVYRMVAHSRALWLRTAGLRAGVFQVCEREALRDVSWNTVFALLLVSGFILARPSLSWALLPWAALLYLSTGLLLGYLGLMLVQGLRVRDLSAGLVLAAPSFVALTPLATDPLRPLPVGVIVALELVAALTLRSIAQRRWTGIDWLRLRGPREIRSQALRPS